MAKLYGEALDEALERRKDIKEDRISQRMTLRKGAKILGERLGMTPEQYIEFEKGYDICPHEAVKTIWGGVPPNYLWTYVSNVGMQIISVK